MYVRSPNKKVLLLQIYGDDARQVEIPLGEGTRPATGSIDPSAVEKYETVVIPNRVESVTKHFRGTKLTNTDFRRISLEGKSLTLELSSTNLPKARTCKFERVK